MHTCQRINLKGVHTIINITQFLECVKVGCSFFHDFPSVRHCGGRDSGFDSEGGQSGGLGLHNTLAAPLPCMQTPNPRTPPKPRTPPLRKKTDFLTVTLSLYPPCFPLFTVLSSLHTTVARAQLRVSNYFLDNV